MTLLVATDTPLANLEKTLVGLLDKPSAKPTKLAYDAVMRVKNDLKNLPEQVMLGTEEETYRIELMSAAYGTISAMEAFYESNGNKWAT